MINKINLVICVLLCNVVMAQTQSGKELVIQQEFKPNKKYTFEIIRGSIDSKQPEYSNVKSVTSIAFQVLSKEKSPLRECSWTYGPTTFIGIDPASVDEKSKIVLNANRGMEIRFLVDDKGVFQSLTNYNQCKLSLDKSFQTMYEMNGGSIKSKEFEQMKTSLRQTYSTPEGLISTYFPEINLYFSFFGAILNTDSVYVDNVALPSPMEGLDFPAIETIKVEAIVSNVATLSIRQTVKEEDMNSVHKKIVQMLGENSENEGKEIDIPRVNFSKSVHYRFDLKNNVMKEVLEENFTETADQKKVTELKIILKE